MTIPHHRLKEGKTTGQVMRLTLWESRRLAAAVEMAMAVVVNAKFTRHYYPLWPSPLLIRVDLPWPVKRY